MRMRTNYIIVFFVTHEWQSLPRFRTLINHLQVRRVRRMRMRMRMRKRMNEDFLHHNVPGYP